MYLKLYFTDEEMIQYLNKRGYEIFINNAEVDVPFHGSLFITTNQKLVEVEKDGYRDSLKNAFEKEIKQQLINN